MRKQFIQKKKPKVFLARCEVCMGVPSFKEEAKLTKRKATPACCSAEHFPWQ
jgi:hypothetical protein